MGDPRELLGREWEGRTQAQHWRGADWFWVLRGPGAANLSQHLIQGLQTLSPPTLLTFKMT